jgi:hypothetical protein
MAKREHTKGSLPFEFVALPKAVIRSIEWQSLPHSAMRLAIDLMGQYTGTNNGRLCPAFVAMEKCGWKSKRTLIDAKRALLGASFVVLTRTGHPPRTAEWIAFTWWKLDYEPSMEVNPKHFPYLNFIKLERIDPNEGRGKPPEKLHSVVQKLHLEPSNKALGGAETVLQGAKA